MFEDSLLESKRGFVSGFTTGSRRWITLGSVGLQCLTAAVIVMIPLVRPEALAFRVVSPAVVVPVPRKPPVVVERRRESLSRAAGSLALPMVQVGRRAAVLPTMRPDDGETATVDPMSVNPGMMSGGAGTGGAGDMLGFVGAGGPKVVVAVKRPEAVRVSAGVSAGMLLGEIRPVYPRIAIAARVEGVVVIEATISKTGAIESARVVCGPAMLQGAAIEAVKGARYRPYRLNGEATEVQTTVTVNFRMGS